MGQGHPVSAPLELVEVSVQSHATPIPIKDSGLGIPGHSQYFCPRQIQLAPTRSEREMFKIALHDDTKQATGVLD
jgi:hypothetical protein